MKFSIIVPVYNVEKYIDKCLKSILEQSYKDYEVIIVNDESPDGSQKIIDKYINMDCRFKSYTKKNGGLSDARNFGVKHSTGEYLIFIDSDDYVEKDLLLNISKCLSGNDIIKYNLNLVDEDGNIIRKAKAFSNEGNVDYIDLMRVEFFQPACGYVYSMKFWTENKLKFSVGRVHEDFGLTPLCVALAKKIYLLNYYGYNYVQRKGSIMNGGTICKKRTDDMLFHYDFLKEQLQQKNIDDDKKKYILSYIANNTIDISLILEKEELNKFIMELKRRKVYKDILANTFIRKLKKILIILNLKLYINIISKK